jgi:hypothetical protein
MQFIYSRRVFAKALFLACVFHGSPMARAASSLSLDNLKEEDSITEGIPAQFRISAAPSVETVVVRSDDQEIGRVQKSDETGKFRFNTIFQGIGDQNLSFVAIENGVEQRGSEVSYNVHIVSSALQKTSKNRLFNAYVLKAVAYLNKNFGLLGYNVRSQITHPIRYYKYGTFEPTGKGMTMCVAGTLEVIMTAFDLYSKDTGDYSVYDFLPFKSWDTLESDSIKSQIWVDPTLHSAGTADAINHFGIGKHVAFKDLQPGAFVNINRTTGTGHSVTFLGFIDIKGNDVPEYNSRVVGFRYFGSQGKGKKGQGGFSYRYAFFSKFGCPEVPYQRDCNVIYSEDQHLLNTGEILDPRLWDHSLVSDVLPESATATQVHSPFTWNGLTTDD